MSNSLDPDQDKELSRSADMDRYRENLSSGFPTRSFSNQPVQLQGLARMLKFCIKRHEISNNLVCATSKGSDQFAHTRSLIRAFASRLNIL